MQENIRACYEIYVYERSVRRAMSRRTLRRARSGYPYSRRTVGAHFIRYLLVLIADTFCRIL